MRVLITGALGWLGKALTETVGKEHTVRVFDAMSPGAPREEVAFDGETIHRSVTKYDDDFWRQSMETGSWVDRYDVARACLHALEIDHRGFDAFHLIGSPQAREKFDVARTEATLGVELTRDFDTRPTRERNCLLYTPSQARKVSALSCGWKPRTRHARGVS